MEEKKKGEENKEERKEGAKGDEGRNKELEGRGGHAGRGRENRMMSYANRNAKGKKKKGKEGQVKGKKEEETHK